MFHTFEQEVFQLRNVQAPSKSSSRNSFYNKLQSFIKHDKKSRLAEDFVMIENIFLGRLGRNPINTHTIGIQTLNCMKNKYKLINIWRKTTPYKIYFTYHNADNAIHTDLIQFT